MNNIEKLAREKGVMVKAGLVGSEHYVYMFSLEQLEAFAIAYAQQQTKPKVESPNVVWCEILDSDLHMLEPTKDTP